MGYTHASSVMTIKGVKMTRAAWRIIVIEAQWLAQNGQTINAIKLLRKHTDCGLIDAVHAMQKLQSAPVITLEQK
jgi:hypothetical protein